jgi:hypothetical protein
MVSVDIVPNGTQKYKKNIFFKQLDNGIPRLSIKVFISIFKLNHQIFTFQFYIYLDIIFNYSIKYINLLRYASSSLFACP